MEKLHPSPTDLESNLVCLRIDGLVTKSCALTPLDLAQLPRASVTEWLPDRRDGVTTQETWCGVRLLHVLRLARPLPIAQYGRVHAGHFVVPIALAAAGDALLVDSWNEQPLTRADGAPWRLNAPLFTIADVSCESIADGK